MTPTIHSFKVKQQPSSGKYWPYLFFLFGFTGLIIGGNDSKLGGYFMVPCLIATVISAIICWQKARGEIQTNKDGMSLQIVKAGFRLALGTTHFMWQDLEWFKYDDGTVDTSPDLELKWLNTSVLCFEDGDIKALSEYLHTFYPEKGRNPPKIRYG
ncbi:MAG: hypothetical protein ACKVU0_03470 [Saprospiraceae bacterium]